MTSPIIECSHVTKIYPNKKTAVSDLSLTIRPGEFFALLGSNGAGKSTLIGLLTGLIRLTSGSISVAGHDTIRDWAEARSYIGVVPQEMNLDQFQSPIEIVERQARYYGVSCDDAKKQAHYYLRRLDLWEQREGPVHRLSGGMKRRLLVARALVHQPKILILDEPTAGVDVTLRHDMWQFLKELNAQGTTIVLTTHYLEEAEFLCQTVAMIEQGRLLFQGSMDEVMRQLDYDTVVVDVSSNTCAIDIPPPYELNVVNDHQWEIHYPSRHGLNALMQALMHAHITVHRMGPKGNRLEQLFLRNRHNDHMRTMEKLI